MSESRLTDGSTSVASLLTALAAPATYDPGFLGVDRRLYRIATDHLGGELADVLVRLTIERDRLSGVTLADLSEILRRSVKVTRRYLTALEAAGAIVWHRAENQYTGSVQIVADLERPNRRRQKLTTSAGTAVDNTCAETSAEPVVMPVVVPIRHDQTETYVYREQEQEQEHPPTPLRDRTLGSVDSGREDLYSGIVIESARIVAAGREGAHGKPAGVGALRKLADQITAEYLDSIAEWVADGHPAHRIATAVAERFRCNRDQITGNRFAVPYSPGDHQGDRREPEPCNCEGDGWIYIEETRTSIRCGCQDRASVGR